MIHIICLSLIGVSAAISLISAWDAHRSSVETRDLAERTRHRAESGDGAGDGQDQP